MIAELCNPLSHYSYSLCQAEYQFQKSNFGGKQHDFISQTPDQKKNRLFSIIILRERISPIFLRQVF